MKILSYGARLVENEIYKEKNYVLEQRKKQQVGHFCGGPTLSQNTTEEQRNLLETEQQLMKKMNEQLLRLSTTKTVEVIKRVSRFTI